MAYISVFPTISNGFRQPTDWRDRREQATPVLNKVLDELTKKSNFKQQCVFLMKCRDRGIAPKGLKVRVPKGIMSVDQEGRFKKKCESELVQKTIRRLFVKQQQADERVAILKLELRNRLKMSGRWIENTFKWLQKKAEMKSKDKKKNLKRKFDILCAEKIKENQKINLERSKPESMPRKQVVYNNSSKKLSPKQEKLLELGLSFAITPKKFPLLEYIAATENLCKSLEDCEDDESMEKAQKIRNIVIHHMKKGMGMKIKENLSSDDKKLIQDIVSDPSIVICPADKGKAIVIEDRDTYLSKMQQQIEDGDYILEKRKDALR